MIGGTDFTFPTRAGASALDLSIREIRREWPEAVFEDALTGERFDDYGSMPLRDITELFIYRDKNLAREWDIRGCEPDLANTMIHLILANDALTIVVDEPSENVIEWLLSTIRDGLAMDIFNISARLERTAA
jgi:hypothetical protein